MNNKEVGPSVGVFLNSGHERASYNTTAMRLALITTGKHEWIDKATDNQTVRPAFSLQHLLDYSGHPPLFDQSDHLSQ